MAKQMRLKMVDRRPTAKVGERMALCNPQRQRKPEHWGKWIGIGMARRMMEGTSISVNRAHGSVSLFFSFFFFEGRCSNDMLTQFEEMFHLEVRLSPAQRGFLSVLWECSGWWQTYVSTKQRKWQQRTDLFKVGCSICISSGNKPSNVKEYQHRFHRSHVIQGRQNREWNQISFWCSTLWGLWVLWYGFQLTCEKCICSW